MNTSDFVCNHSDKPWFSDVIIMNCSFTTRLSEFRQIDGPSDEGITNADFAEYVKFHDIITIDPNKWEHITLIIYIIIA